MSATINNENDVAKFSNSVQCAGSERKAFAVTNLKNNIERTTNYDGHFIGLNKINSNQCTQEKDCSARVYNLENVTTTTKQSVS